MVYSTLSLKIQTIPFYISNPLRNLAIVKEDKDHSNPDPSNPEMEAVDPNQVADNLALFSWI